jgi:hypothetical protein
MHAQVQCQGSRGTSHAVCRPASNVSILPHMHLLQIYERQARREQPPRSMQASGMPESPDAKHHSSWAHQDAHQGCACCRWNIVRTTLSTPLSIITTSWLRGAGLGRAASSACAPCRSAGAHRLTAATGCSVRASLWKPKTTRRLRICSGSVQHQLSASSRVLNTSQHLSGSVATAIGVHHQSIITTYSERDTSHSTICSHDA